MGKYLEYFMILFCCMGVSAQENGKPVFVSGTNGYRSYRIPALVNLPSGELLAFCEGRVNGGADYGDVDIVLRRSRNKGFDWDSLQVVVNNGPLQAGNPAPVLDMTDPDYPGGRLFLFYNTGNNSEEEIRKGNGSREVWYITSINGGRTWSPPINISSQVHLSSRRDSFNNSSVTADWRSYANTPGHALQFRYGRYKGRIYVAANHSSGPPRPHFEDYSSHGYYTDDHGRTFHLSETVNFPGSNEATAAELKKGRLMLNMRNQKGIPRQRIVAISNTGGEKWDRVIADPRLPDPVCEGSLLNIARQRRRTTLAFCNAADSMERNNLTLRISNNEGKSWRRNYLIYSGRRKNDPSAYCDIAEVDRNRIGVLFEKDNYKEIFFKIVKWQ